VALVSEVLIVVESRLDIVVAATEKPCLPILSFVLGTKTLFGNRWSKGLRDIREM